MSGSAVVAGAFAHGQRRGASETAFLATALLAVVMMVGALLTPVNTSSFVSTGDLATAARELFAPSTSAEEQALLDQLAAVGEGVSFAEQVGGLDARFMLAGPVFDSGSAPFSVATSTYMGQTVEAVAPALDGDRIIYERGDVTEWWVQVGSAYEQGWTIATAPADGSTDLSLLVGFGNAAPLAESATTVQLRLSDNTFAWYSDLFAVDATGTELPATMTVDGSNVRIDVDAAGAVYPVTIDPIVDADQEILPPATATGDRFGEAIATDGNRMAVSAREADRPGGLDPGADRGRVDIFDWDSDGGVWNLLDSVDYPGDGSADFGWSVDIFGNSLVVGAPADDTNGANAGAVFFYTLSGGTYNLTQTLYECSPAVGAPCDGSAAGGFDGGEFGYDVAIADFDLVLVGAPSSSALDSVNPTGAAYAYSATGGGGALELRDGGVLSYATPAAGDRFGEAVDITEDLAYVIVGIPGRDVGGFTDNGSVQGYTIGGPTWVATGTDSGPSFVAGAEYGSSVAINYDSSTPTPVPIAVAGRPFRSRRNPVDTGMGTVRVMNAANGLTTVGLGSISAFTTNDGFGYDVAFENDTVMVGAPFNNGVDPETGAAYAYTYLIAGTMDGGGTASAVALNNASDIFNQGFDQYGHAVAIAEMPNFFVVGSPGHDELQNGRFAESAGKVGVYTPDNPTTTVVGVELTAPTSDEFGYSVAISGNRMAVGAIGDDEPIGSNGAVLFYERASSTDPWVFDTVLSYPDEAVERAGLYGYSLDMEGDYLAVGSPGGLGDVTVYEHDGTEWAVRDFFAPSLADNLTGDFAFGTDVAISNGGDLLSVAVPGYDGGGCTDCGGVYVFQWNGDGASYDLITVIVNTDPAIQAALSIDSSPVPASSFERIIIGREGTGSEIDSWLVETSDLVFNPQFESSLDVVYNIGQSVALDGNRLAAATSAGVNDALYVADINEVDGEWVPRLLFEGALANDLAASPNNFVDVAGDTIVVGRADGAGGEVGVFYNHPSYGWGMADEGLGWTEGPQDRIQPAGRLVEDAIGRSVAIDGLAAEKSIIIGAPGTDDSGDMAGAAFATKFTQSGVVYLNKEVPPTFGSGQFGALIAMQDTVAVVAEPQSSVVHRLEFDGSNWSITQTLADWGTGGVSAIDLSPGHILAVMPANGNDMYTYEEDCDVTCEFITRGSGDSFEGVPASLGIDEATDRILLATPDGNGIDAYLSLNDTGSGGPLGFVGGHGVAQPSVIPSDEFGTSMAVSDGYAVVGAPGTNSGDGAIWIYDFAGNTFTGPIGPPSAGVIDGRFGQSVALDGTRLVVGAPDFDADGSVDGEVYVYDFAGGATPTVDLSGVLSPINGSGDSLWGQSVAVDGDVIIVGGTGYEESGIDFRDGTAVAFGFDGVNWVETDRFDHLDDAAGDQAGAAVGVAGLNVLVGVPQDDNAQGVDAGAVYSYEATPAVPAIPNKIISPDPTSGEFGRHLDIIGTTAVVAEQAGDKVHILDQVGGTWTVRQTFVVDDVRAVAMDANRMAALSRTGNLLYLFEEDCSEGCSYSQVGAPRNLGGGVPASVVIDGDDIFVGLSNGAVPLEHHLWAGGTVPVVAPPGALAGEEAGFSIARDGDLVFLGSPRWDNITDDEAGRVYIYDTLNQTWGGTIQADQPGSLFGLNLVAEDGRLVVGHPHGIGLVNGGPGTAEVGAVETYTTLTPAGATIEQVLTSDDLILSDFFGSAVDIDGDILVVGANAKALPVVSRAGKVYTFTFDGAVWTENETFVAEDGALDDQLGNDIGISGTSILAGAWKDDNQRGVNGGAVYSFVASQAPDNPTLFFDLNLDPAGPTSVAVAPAGIAVSDFNAEVLEDASDDGTSVAAAAFGATDVAGSPLSSLPLSSLPLSSLAAAPGSAIGNIPLVELDLEGGWEKLFIDAGSPLTAVPLVDLTFADVANDPLARAEFDSERTLAQLSVEGSPLSSLPLSSLVIGSVPLSSLAADANWCAILAGFIDEICGTRLLADVTLLEATLSGVPLSSLPLSSLPLSSLPLSSLPLSSLPLSSLNLGASPLSSLPLSSLPLSSLTVSGVPLSSLPLSSLPLSSLPLSSLNVGASPLSSLPLSSLDAAGIPLSSLELSNVPLSSLPLSSLTVDGAPLSSLPLSSLPLSSLVLADAPLSSLPLSILDPSLPDWCTYLADLDLGFDCSYGETPTAFLASTTIADLGVQGIPLSSLPLSSLPLSSLALDSSPLSSLPLSSLPLSSLPLSSLPLSSLPLSSLDLTDTPLSSLGGDLASVPLSSLDVAGSPLSSLPLSSLDITGTPLSSLPLSSLPLSSLPLSSLPLSSLQVAGSPLSSLPLSSLDITGTPLSSLPLSSLPLSSLGVNCTLVDCAIDSLGDAIQRGAVDGSTITLNDLDGFLSGVRLDDIANALLSPTGVTDVQAGLALLPSTNTLGNAPTLDDLELGDIPQSFNEARTTLLGELEDALWSVRFDALLGSMINPNTGQPFTDTQVEAALDAAFGARNVSQIENLGDATLGDLLAGDDGSFTLADLGPILGLVHLVDVVGGVTKDNATLGDLLTLGELGDLTILDLIGLGEEEFDDLTLTDLLVAAGAAGALYGFDVADLLLALIGVDLTPFSNIEFTELETGQLPASLLPAVTFVAEFEVRDTLNKKTVEVTAQIPATASYVPGSSTAIDEDLNDFTKEPVVSGNSLTWTVSGAIPDKIVFLTFDVKPTVTIGSTNINATASILGTDTGGAAAASISVTEGIEPNDFPDTTPASEDTVYLTYISSETDNDVFEINVLDNDQLAIQLSSLTSDLDFALYGTPADTSVGAALTGQSPQAPLNPVTDPDQATANSESLDDFRRLDEEDSALEFIDVSNSPGNETELLVTDALPAGTYYVQVFGANGATNVEPAALQIQVLKGDDRPDCAAGPVISGTTGIFPALAGSTANTLILVNEQRTEALYPGEWTALETEVNELVAYLNNNPELGIDPIVVPVDGDGVVQSAYAAWDSDTGCSPESANAVVEAIIERAVDPLRDTLEHIVLVGGDQVIPMARLLDVTGVANEYDYRHEFIGDNSVGGTITDINAFSASFWDRQYLSDEPYGEAAARSLGNRFLYVSDIALGRMVETPDEIRAALQHFQDFDGALQAETAAILGYDFLADSSAEISADLLDAGLLAANVDDDLADGFVGPPANNIKWDKDDAAAKILPVGGAPDLISLNGHFDHYRALPADGDQVPNFTNNFLADTVAGATPGLLQGSIVFSMGCHGGLNVSDLQIANTNGDWAQTFAADQAIFVGNTGFGYGDTEAVAYTEKLMALFAEQAIRPIQIPGATGTTTIGQALTFAKNDYASDLSVFSVYDEKALMESTFYGLPFYRVGATPVAADPVPTTATIPDSTGNESFTFTADSSNTERVTPTGSIFSNPDENGDPQVIVAPGMPIQPSQTIDVSVIDTNDSSALGAIARGALVLDMSSTYTSPVDPVVSAAIFNESVNAPEPKLGDVVFPAKPVTVNRVTTPGGERQKVVLATGQFDSDGSVQRLDDDIDVVVYYADAADGDFTKPKIGAVESTLETTGAGAELTVNLRATDAGGADAPVVTRVYLLVAANPGAGEVDWVGLDLAKEPASDEWSGSALLPLGTLEAEFLVQAVDGSGNVGFATNKARNFNDDGTVVPDPPAPGLQVTVSQANFNAPSGWYTGAVDVTVASGGVPATYVVQPGGTAAPIPVGGVITITRNGVNRLTVTRSDGQKVTKTVRIDTQNPTVSIAPPANGAVFFASTVPKVGFVCQDPSLVSCTATADGAPIQVAGQLPTAIGSHTVIATAVDALGNDATKTVGYVVQPDPPVGDPPVITDVEIDGVALPGEPVDIFGEFTDGVGPFTLSVDWGDGAVCPGDGSCLADGPAGGAPGTFEASYTYPTGGSYSVVVTVTDSAGASDSITVTTATCTITGTSGPNYINGTNGADVICGLGGNDRINGRGGNDIIFGGTGDDVLRGQNGADEIHGGRGNDVLLGHDGTDTLFGGRGNDLLSGGYRNDVLRGRLGNDVLIGGSGSDRVVGDQGNDQIYGGGGNDDLEGRSGNDFISGWFGADVISGGSGNDTIFGGFGGDTINSGDGQDWVSGGAGADNIDGGRDDDNLRGDWGNDTIEGGDGFDRCRGGYGSDTLTGCES